jgi:hypothetical protein
MIEDKAAAGMRLRAPRGIYFDVRRQRLVGMSSSDELLRVRPSNVPQPCMIRADERKRHSDTRKRVPTIAVSQNRVHTKAKGPKEIHF